MTVRAMICPGLHLALGPAAVVYCGVWDLTNKPTCYDAPWMEKSHHVNH